MPAWTAGFQIEAGEKVIGAREVSFRYLLRPRAVGETAIPRIKFRYFNPSAAEGKQLQTAYTEGLTLMVNSARKSDTTRREIPSRFLTPVTDSPSLVLVHPWQWMISIPVSLLTIPLISWLFHAKSAGQSKLTRSRAGVRATRQLAEAHRSEDPAGIVSQTINEYLSTRPDLNRDEAAALLTACDEARFSPKREQRNSLIHDAGRLIAKWEETA